MSITNFRNPLRLGLGGRISTMPAVKAKNANPTVCATGVTTIIAFDGVDDWDTSNMHDPAVNNSRFTVPSKGKYHVATNCTWASAAAPGNLLNIVIRINGSTFVEASTITGQTAIQQMHICTVLSLEKDDYIEIGAFHDNGSNRNIITTSRVTVTKLND